MKPLVTLAAISAALAAGNLPAEVRGQDFDSQGVKIHYLVAGQGEPVVLIHGLYSNAAINWQLPGTMRLLSESYRVIAPDVRGHGQSGKPDKEAAYGVELAEDVVRLLDHLHIDKAHIAGYSMGGMIAMKLAATHPDRIQSIVLGGMGWLRDGSGLANFWSHVPERQQQRAETPSALLRTLGKLAITEDELKSIRLPVSVLVGDRDPAKQLYVVPLHRIRPEWPVTEIDGAGHFLCIVKPQFKEELKQQLDRQAKK